MDCYRCGAEMTLGTDDHYRCVCNNIMHIRTAEHVSEMLSLSVDEVVARAQAHLAWCRAEEASLGWRSCYGRQSALTR